MTFFKYINHFILFTFISVTLTLFSCTISDLQNEGSEVNEIKLGKRFRVNLPENHSDGYTWQLNMSYNTKLISYDNSVWHGKRKGIDFNFSSLDVGQTTLTFIKRKYNDTNCVKSFIVKIIPD